MRVLGFDSVSKLRAELAVQILLADCARSDDKRMIRVFDKGPDKQQEAISKYVYIACEFIDAAEASLRSDRQDPED